MFSKIATTKSTENYSEQIERFSEALDKADTVIIGAGAGLSTSAGFVYTGERFDKYFSDFSAKYGFQDMYSGGFYPYAAPKERWAFWSRFVYINRYMNPPKPVYQQLFELVKDKDYFVLTTNVDHCFQKVGFDKARLFYTQGDYGLFQCSRLCGIDTYDNYETVRDMVLAQGYAIGEDGELLPPIDGAPKTAVPTELLPICPKCGVLMSMNLRADNTFVGLMAADRYSSFIRSHRAGRVLFLELGVGYNTPGIIKYPFWQMTAENPRAVYVRINAAEAFCPREIEERTVCIGDDIGAILS